MSLVNRKFDVLTFDAKRKINLNQINLDFFCRSKVIFSNMVRDIVEIGILKIMIQGLCTVFKLEEV